MKYHSFKINSVDMNSTEFVKLSLDGAKVSVEEALAGKGYRRNEYITTDQANDFADECVGILNTAMIDMVMLHLGNEKSELARELNLASLNFVDGVLTKKNQGYGQLIKAEVFKVGKPITKIFGNSAMDLEGDCINFDTFVGIVEDVMNTKVMPRALSIIELFKGECKLKTDYKLNTE